jgi:hypothetical protein
MVGEMPAGRKPFAVGRATEPDFCADLERQREAANALARWHFDDRERFAQEYLEQTICLGKGKVFLQGPMGKVSGSDFLQAIEAEGLEFYETFVKLVRAEEDELREPYALSRAVAD